MALEISKHVSSVVTHEIPNKKKAYAKPFFGNTSKKHTSHLGKRL